jgi:TonB family protein
MRRRPILLLLLIFPVLSAPVFAESLKDALNHEYQKHLLALRPPFTSGDQKFDSTGRPLAQPEGKWLLYGGIFVEKINVSSKSLRVEGRRIGFGEDKNNQPVAFTLGKRVRIEIQLDQPLHSPDEARALLDRVFFPESAGRQHAQPELRRADFNPADATIYKAGKDGVQYPHAKYTPEPDFSEQARRARYQGTAILNVIVDQTGKIARVRLERALGAGLDENAMETIKDWRFDPATREGQPVAVEMKIEVSFALH